MVKLLLLSVGLGCAEDEAGPEKISGVLVGPSTCLADESLAERCARGGLGAPWARRRCPTLDEANATWPIDSPETWCASGWFPVCASLEVYSTGACFAIDSDVSWFDAFDPVSGELRSVTYTELPSKLWCGGEPVSWVIWGDPVDNFVVCREELW